MTDPASGATDWQPVTLAPALRDEAKAALATIGRVMTQMVDQDAVRQWVGSLGVLTASGAMGSGDAEAKLDSYPSMLAGRYPAVIFTRDALDRAARQFKFFPSYAELTERLDGEVLRRNRASRKLERLIRGPRQMPAPAAPSLPAQSTEAILKRAGEAVSAPKGRASAEVSPASAEQLAGWAREIGIDAL